MKKLSFTLLLLLFFLPARSAEMPINDADSARFSLLTCASGEAIYSLFGHTAIRYEDPAKGIDIVFNYGLFSFSTPNFILRFALGETDYLLGATSYENFATEYYNDKRNVWQQSLNLTNEEKHRLLNQLEENAQPENRIYRYNFFYDNCATRPRDKIEESIAGKVIYQPLALEKNKTSFRDIIHQYTQGHSWAQFGIDLCIGRDADYPITDRQSMFAPFYLMNSFSAAQIESNGNHKQLVTRTERIIDCNVEKEKTRNINGDNWTPLRCFLLLFMVVITATIYGIRKKKSLWGIDLLLFTTAGVVGCILAFLVLFSEHPAVDCNYLLFVFHPIHLLALPFIIIVARKGLRSRYHILNSFILTLFILLFPLIPQRIDFAVVPLALCLLIRSVSNLILTYRKNK